MHRTLVIGVAGRGRSWAGAVARHDRFELTGFADIDPKILAERADQCHIPPAHRHEDYREALASGQYDVAVVATPNHTHYPVTKDVLAAGVHCLLEKPFVEKMEHAEELVRLADEKKVVLEIVQNYRFRPWCRFVEEAIRTRRLGRLGGIEGTFHRHRPPRFEHERVMDFPMLFLQAIHHLDWLVAIVPAPIVEVISRHRRVPWSEWRNPSICHIVLRCEDGVLISYRGSYESRGDVSPYNGLWRLEFETGDLIVDENGAIWEVTADGEKRQQVFRPEENETSGDDWLLDTLHEAIVNGIEPPTSGRQNLKTLKLLFDVISAGSRT